MMPNNTFYVRRARVKFTYEATDGLEICIAAGFQHRKSFT